MKKYFKSQLFKKIFLYVIAAAIYIVLLKKIDLFSVIYTQKDSLFVEGPLVLIVYYIFFISIKPGWRRYLLSAFPVTLFYLLFEIYYRTWGSAFKIVTIKQLPELFEVLATFHSIGLLFVIFVFGYIFLNALDYQKRKNIISSALMIILIVTIVECFPDVYLNYFDIQNVQVSQFSDVESVQSNGRLSMVLYWEAKRRQAISKLREIPVEQDLELPRLLQTVKQKKNVHLIVMESLFNPSLMEKVKFSRDPIHPELKKIFKEIGLSRSPVFGGRSAQAEFEVLCGAPALSEYDDIEFNVFGGARTSCLPSVLDSAGYLTIATNAFRPNYFNTDVAYHGLGFKEIYFPQENSKGNVSYFKKGDVGKEGFIFDGDLLTENFKFIRDKLENDQTRPIFNYVMTSYGHYPFKIDYNIRPKVIEVIDSGGEDVEIMENISNQIYYRTAAIAEYASQIKQIDPNGIVIIVGDHLPSLDPPFAVNKLGPDMYKKLGYLNENSNNYKYSFFASNYNDTRININDINHYNITQLILYFLSDGKYPFEKDYINGREYEYKYNKIMAEAVRQK